MFAFPTTMNDRVIFGIFTAENHCPRVKVNRNIVPQKQASRQILTRWQVNCPATLPGARVDHALNCTRIQSLSIANCAVLAYVEGQGVPCMCRHVNPPSLMPAPSISSAARMNGPTPLGSFVVISSLT